MNMDNKENELQAKIDNVATVLKIEERLEEAIPLLSEFDKGYILGKTED